MLMSRKTCQLKKTEDGGNIFFKALALFGQTCRVKRIIKFFMMDILSNVFHERITRSRFDGQFVKKIPFAMIISQQIKETGHKQNY